MKNDLNSSVVELLMWLARQNRSYTETMAAWRSSCPRHTTWEDALDSGLVQVVEDRVLLTETGRIALSTETSAPV